MAGDACFRRFVYAIRTQDERLPVEKAAAARTRRRRGSSKALTKKKRGAKGLPTAAAGKPVEK